MLAERLYSENNEVQEEKLYSTGDSELDDLLERAFCEGYEYAQREFGRTGKSPGQAKMWFEGGNGKLNKQLKQLWEIDKGADNFKRLVKSEKDIYKRKEKPWKPYNFQFSNESRGDGTKEIGVKRGNIIRMGRRQLASDYDPATIDGVINTNRLNKKIYKPDEYLKKLKNGAKEYKYFKDYEIERERKKLENAARVAALSKIEPKPTPSAKSIYKKIKKAIKGED